MSNTSTLDLQEKCRTYINQHHLISSTDHILLAVSGGVDSVTLCHLFYVLGYSFSIAHCNFTLRQEASDKDEYFVRNLASRYNVLCYTQQFATQAFADQEGLSIQEAARILRYRWFKELCAKHNLTKLATAHHADDNLETVLINLVRGTGLAGLRGILPRQEKIIRPLLFASKEEILGYAQWEGLLWREDESNKSNYYRRNYIRHKIIPLLKALNPNLLSTFQNTVYQVGQAEDIVQHQTNLAKNTSFIKKEKTYHLDIEKFLITPGGGLLLGEILLPFGFTHLQVKDLLYFFGKLYSKDFEGNEDGAQKSYQKFNACISLNAGRDVSPELNMTHKEATWHLTRTGTIQDLEKNLKKKTPPKRISSKSHWLYIYPNEWIIRERNSSPATPLEFLETPVIDKEITQTGTTGRFTYRLYDSSSAILQKENYIAWLDAEKLVFPLTLRVWQAGDYFYPLGMKHKKKVSDFLIDAKVPLWAKDDVWVLLSGTDIVWIVGHRIDDRYKITDQTSKALRIAYFPDV